MKAMRWVKLFFVILILGVLVLGPVSRSYAQPLPEAKFYGALYWTFVSGAPTPDTPIVFYREGIISYDCAIRWVSSTDPSSFIDASYVATLKLTGGSRPMLDLQGSTHFVGNIAGGDGRITYYLRTDKKDPYAPDVTVPLLVSSSGHVSVNNVTYGYSSVSSWFGTPSNPVQDQILSGFTTDTAAHWEGSRTITENVPLGETYAILMTVRSFVQAYDNNSASGEFQAIIDPTVKIDPDWMVDYNGQQVPGTQLYSVTFSPGFNAVTLPGVLMLLLD